MTVKPTSADSENDSSPPTKGETIPLQGIIPFDPPILDHTEILIGRETQSLEESKEENVVTRIELPEPDTENITVLSHKLPNKPILPWNRYDSPWEEQENSDLETSPEQQEETIIPEDLSKEREPDEVE